MNYTIMKHNVELKKSDSRIAYNFISNLRDLEQDEFDNGIDLVVKELKRVFMDDIEGNTQDYNTKEEALSDLSSDVYIGLNLMGNGVKFYPVEFEELCMYDDDTCDFEYTYDIKKSLTELYDYWKED